MHQQQNPKHGVPLAGISLKGRKAISKYSCVFPIKMECEHRDENILKLLSKSFTAARGPPRLADKTLNSGVPHQTDIVVLQFDPGRIEGQNCR